MTEQAFYNKVINGTAMKRLISRLINHFGMGYTSHILDQVKALGFHQATATSISLGIDDLLTISSKQWLVQDVQQQNSLLEEQHDYGNVHTVEKLRQSIEIWYATSEYLKQEMNHNFGMTDPSNPVYLMSFSGARGNVSQIHQLVGMRGLMSDPQGQMIDLPIQSNLREGLSLIEYIISCYGARKGVVDTAIRTADAGYLTRRLVEVVQHIIVRRRDCGTIRGSSVSSQNGMTETMFVQTLIGRVLADDIYIGLRCIATRNQDIGIGLINQFLTFRIQRIYIRTPFTCRSTSWICQLCYGWSPTHSDLVELGEAVGILAGQSIGEPGTQLTLRTFHTGGVFTGGTAEHIRAPSHGKIKFDENLVHPTRTRHGYPAFLCSIDLYVTIESRDSLHNVNIPPKSLILVQNDQYIQSEQVIAEIRTGMSTFPFKKKVRKHIYSESGGEMHWSTDVYRAPKHAYSNIHLLLKTSHLWILAGSPCRSSIVSFSIHKDQDKMNVSSFSVDGRYISNLSTANDQVTYKLLDTSGKKDSEIIDYSRPDGIISNDHWNFIYPSIRQENSFFLAKKRRNRFIIPLQYNKEQEKELIPCFAISIEISRNGILPRNSIFAYFDDPRYKRSSSGITQYGTIEVDSIIKKEDLIEDQETKKFLEYQTLIEYEGTKEFNPEYQILIEYQKSQMLIEYQRTEELSPEYQTLIEDQRTEELSPEYQRKVDQFFFIPEEVYILPRSSFIMVRNNSIIGVDTLLTLNTRSRVGGFVQVERTKKYIELKIFSGNIHFPGETDNISRHNDILIPRETEKKNSKKRKDWIYVQGITPTKKKYFVLVRPVITYDIPDERILEILDKRNLEISDEMNFSTLFPQDLLQEKDNLQLRVINYFLYGNSKSIRIISLTSIQLVRTCLVLNWDQEQKGSIKEVHASFVEVKANDLIRDFIRIELVRYTISYTCIGKRYDRASSGLIPDNRLDRTNINPFYSKAKIQSLSQHQGTIGTLLNRDKESQSLIILSSSNCSRINLFQNNTVTKKKNFLFLYGYSVGPLGTLIPKIGNFHSFYHLITHNEILLKKYLLLDNLKDTFLLFRLIKIFLLDIGNYNLDPCFIFKPSYLKETLKVFQVQVLKFYLIDKNRRFHRRFHSRQIFKKVVQVFELSKYCLIDENRKIYNPDPCGSFILNPFHWNWSPFFHDDNCEETSTIMSLGQFICENVCLFKDKSHGKKSGQVVIVNLDSLVIRSAKPYLLTSGTTVHGDYGEILYEGDTLVTFLYEKSRSSDITQGLPKVDQLVEVRSIDSISINLKRQIAGWDKGIPRILGVPWVFLIGTELTIAQSRISLVNKIQKIYQSQGVQIHNKHIELIVRQVTSKVLVSEEGMSNIFLPRELIGLLRAERAGRALDESICYRAILLGITRVSLNTQSFISEASFQETARVLAKAALRGRIDWLKGLKENVVLGRILPIGTGLKKFVYPSRQDKNFDLEIKRKNLFELEMRDIMLNHKELFCFDVTNNLHETNFHETSSEQSFMRFYDS